MNETNIRQAILELWEQNQAVYIPPRGEGTELQIAMLEELPKKESYVVLSACLNASALKQKRRATARRLGVPGGIRTPDILLRRQAFQNIRKNRRVFIATPSAEESIYWFSHNDVTVWYSSPEEILPFLQEHPDLYETWRSQFWESLQTFAFWNMADSAHEGLDLFIAIQEAWHKSQAIEVQK